MAKSTQRSKNNPQIVKSLYMMKLRYVEVSCGFCDLVHSSTHEIKRLKAINARHGPDCDCDWVNDSCFYRSTDPDFESNYIDCVLWKNPHIIVCETCADCLGGITRRYLEQCVFEASYRHVTKKLL